MIQTRYEIVKAHGWDPDRARRQAGSYREKIETKEGEGATFILILPEK